MFVITNFEISTNFSNVKSIAATHKFIYVTTIEINRMFISNFFSFIMYSFDRNIINS